MHEIRRVIQRLQRTHKQVRGWVAGRVGLSFSRTRPVLRCRFCEARTGVGQLWVGQFKILIEESW